MSLPHAAYITLIKIVSLPAWLKYPDPTLRINQRYFSDIICDAFRRLNQMYFSSIVRMLYHQNSIYLFHIFNLYFHSFSFLNKKERLVPLLKIYKYHRFICSKTAVDPKQLRAFVAGYRRISEHPG